MSLGHWYRFGRSFWDTLSFVDKILIGDSDVVCMKGLKKSIDKQDRLKRLKN